MSSNISLLYLLLLIQLLLINLQHWTYTSSPYLQNRTSKYSRSLGNSRLANIHRILPFGERFLSFPLSGVHSGVWRRRWGNGRIRCSLWGICRWLFGHLSKVHHFGIVPKLWLCEVLVKFQSEIELLILSLILLLILFLNEQTPNLG